MNLISNPSNFGRGPTAHGPRTVLVVDDEPMIRELLVIMLQSAGCRVLSAEDGAQALAMIEALPADSIDVLITDLCMPGLSGAQLAAELTAIRPRIKVIFTSGYSPEEIAAMGLEVPDAAYLSKPFRAGAVDAAIRSLFDPMPVLC